MALIIAGDLLRFGGGSRNLAGIALLRVRWRPQDVASARPRIGRGAASSARPRLWVGQLPDLAGGHVRVGGASVRAAALEAIWLDCWTCAEISRPNRRAFRRRATECTLLEASSEAWRPRWRAASCCRQCRSASALCFPARPKPPTARPMMARKRAPASAIASFRIWRLDRNRSRPRFRCPASRPWRWRSASTPAVARGGLAARP